jgi:hypothetical protein
MALHCNASCWCQHFDAGNIEVDILMVGIIEVDKMT